MSSQLFSAPPERLKVLRPRHLFSYLGPGLIIASVTIGSGELVWASRSGAIFGYQLFWCFLLAGIFKAVQVYVASRHLTLTGEHPMVSWRKIPGPPLWLPILITIPTLMVMPIAFSSISEILGAYLRELTGISNSDQNMGVYEGFEFWQNFWAAMVITSCLGLAMCSTLQTLERVSAAVLGLIVFCAAISVIACRPDLLAFTSGMLVPKVPDYESWVTQKYPKIFADRSPWLEVALYLSAVGGGTYDYIGYVGMVREKRWGLAGQRVATRSELETLDSQQLEHARIWTRAPLLDAIISFTGVILVTLLFATLGVLLLHTQQIIPDNRSMLSVQEAFLTQLHPQLLWLYRGGVLLAFVGTLYGAFEVYRHTVTETAYALVPKWISPANEMTWHRATVAACYIGGMLMIWLPQQIAGDVLSRMTFGAVFGGALLCGVWCFAMLWTDKVRLPPAMKMNRGLRYLTFIAGIAMTSLGVQSIVEFFRAPSH